MTPTLPITAKAAAAWGADHQTHPAVAMALHTLGRRDRPAEVIWIVPTIDEFEAVGREVIHLVKRGVFADEPSGIYRWRNLAIRTRWVNCALVPGSETCPCAPWPRPAEAERCAA